MAIYENMRAQLQELVDLVKQDEQYAAAVATEKKPRIRACDK
jgi:hypothetical protein